MWETSHVLDHNVGTYVKIPAALVEDPSWGRRVFIGFVQANQPHEYMFCVVGSYKPSITSATLVMFQFPPLTRRVLLEERSGTSQEHRNYASTNPMKIHWPQERSSATAARIFTSVVVSSITSSSRIVTVAGKSWVRVRVDAIELNKNKNFPNIWLEIVWQNPFSTVARKCKLSCHEEACL